MARGPVCLFFFFLSLPHLLLLGEKLPLFDFGSGFFFSLMELVATHSTSRVYVKVSMNVRLYIGPDITVLL